MVLGTTSPTCKPAGTDVFVACLLRLCQISARSPEVKDSAAGLSLEEGCATAGSHEIKATVAKHTTAISFRVEATSIASLAVRQKSLGRLARLIIASLIGRNQTLKLRNQALVGCDPLLGLVLPSIWRLKLKRTTG